MGGTAYVGWAAPATGLVSPVEGHERLLGPLGGLGQDDETGRGAGGQRRVDRGVRSGRGHDLQQGAVGVDEPGP